jgi:hypothetical protein
MLPPLPGDGPRGDAVSRNGAARLNARRDANERAIITAFEALGCLVWQLSGKGLPDLLVMTRVHRTTGRESYFLVDAKMPDGGYKPAQVEKWGEAHDRGIPIFVVRSVEDARAVLHGTATPWGRMDAAPKRKAKAHTPGVSKARTAADLCHMDYCPTSKAKGSTWCTKHGPKGPSAPRSSVAPCTCRARNIACIHVATKALARRYASLGSPAIAAETFAPPSRCNRGHPDCALEHPESLARAKCGCTIEVECVEHAREAAL